jgi:serine/threonine protein kinase
MKSDRSIDDNQPNTGTETAGPNQSDISENKSKRHATHQRNGNERREQALIGISSDSRDSKCGTINSEAAKIHATGANKLGSPLNCDSEMTIDLSIDDIQPITGVENACLIQSDISKKKSDSSEAHDGISLQLLDTFQGMNIRDQRHMSTVDYQPNIGAGNAEHQLEERRKRVLFGSSSDSLDSNSGTSKSEMAKIYTTSANTHTYGEPKIMRGVLFSMQSKIIDNSFRLDSYIDLWTLEMPEPKRRSITIGKKNFEVSSFGESIKPFLHQATFNLLSLDTTDNWIGIHNNQSFIIHLAVAMNRCPFALHTMFARNCKRRAKENGVWTHDALEQVYPFDRHMNVVILSNESHDSPCAIQQYTSPSHGHEEQAIVLLREGMNYSWLKNADMRDMNLITSQQLCRSAACVTWESLTATSVCIEGNPNSNEATSTMKQEMWDNACAAVGLRESSTGKWETLPPGFGRDLSLQDGSLTPASFEKLLQMMQKKQINCQMVADLGSEAGHAVARFAFKPFVKQVTGIEIQFTWAAYSAIIMLQLQSASQNNNSYFADTCIIHDSFLNTENHLWGNALQKADLCFCNNVNWEKGGKANPVPKEHQQLKGEFKHSIDANVAELLGEYMKRNSHIVVFNSKNFSNQRYQYLDKLEVQATWSTKEEVRLLKTNSYHFKYLIPALQALCQNNSVDFDKIPRDWFAYEGHSPSATGYVVLKNHVMKSAAWKKSNAAVHLGWRIQSDNIPQAVCIKHFPSTTMERIIQKEIEILNLIARGEKPLQNNVIGFLGTDTNKGCTVLVFEMVQSSNFYTDLQSISMNKIALYTFKLLQALEFLNQKDVVHRDVKPDNFLHNFETNIFKLIDFGSSVKGTKGFQAKGGGTTGFKAPEILMGAMHQTAAVDIWSAGIIMLIMLTGDRYILSRATEKDKNWAHLKEITAIVGYEKMHEVAAYLHEAETFTSHVLDQQSRIISTNVRGWTAIVEQKRLWETDTDSLDLLSQMLDVDPRTRITARDALKHPFFNQFRK